MTNRRRSPRQLGLALDQLRDELAPQTLLAGIQRVWEATVGAGIAEQARPTAERGGDVVVSCAGLGLGSGA